MVSKCANPDCQKQLHYLRDGKIFRFEMSRIAATDKKAAEVHNEHFWLCGECCKIMSLESAAGSIRVVKKTIRARSTVYAAHGAMAS